MTDEKKADELALLVADIYEAAAVLRRYGEQIASTAGQTQARWQTMSVISVGDWTVPRAAERLGTSRQAVQRVVNELVGEGLATLVANPHHARSPLVKLTDEGIRVLAVIGVTRERSRLPMMDDLGEFDLAGLRTQLRRLTQAVRVELDESRRKTTT